MSDAAILVLAGATACLGALGGLGGAALLVPLLVLGDVAAEEAATLGLLSVAAGSLAAAPTQIAEGLVNHRLGVTTEIAASAGAFGGAILAGYLDADLLAALLGLVAIVAGVVAAARPGVAPEGSMLFEGETTGEWPGSLAGLYSEGGRTVPYEATRLAAGLAATGLAGVTAGLSGTSGGFIKTPALHLLMRVPVKVAAATTTFTVGITAASGLIVHFAESRVEVATAGAVVAGAIAGGRLGAVLQSRLPARVIGRVLAVALIGAGVAVLVGS